MWISSTKAFNTHQILKAKDTRALGTCFLTKTELRVLVLTKRHAGSGNEIGDSMASSLAHASFSRASGYKLVKMAGILSIV